jgi:hypothetical protein
MKVAAQGEGSAPARALLSGWGGQGPPSHGLSDEPVAQTFSFEIFVPEIDASTINPPPVST